LALERQLRRIVRRIPEQIFQVRNRNARRPARRRGCQLAKLPWFRRDGRTLRSVLFRASACKLPRNARDPALELTNARLARVPLDDLAQHLWLDGHAFRLQPVLSQLPRNEELPRDRELLLIEVSREADDLHAIAQRLR